VKKSEKEREGRSGLEGRVRRVEGKTGKYSFPNNYLILKNFILGVESFFS
jgi:hypothetical protein